MSEGRDYPDLDALTSSAAFGALSGASRAKADEFLTEQILLAKEQVELARLQADDLRREDAIRHWSLRVRHVSDLMKLAFELSLAFIFLVLAVGLAAVVWSASQDDGLVIESFSVPPEMAARGLDGRVVASQLLDKLVHMQNQTGSFRPARSYASNWGGDIKVQIPDTGVSVGEAYRFLVQWLGHETQISGEVFRTADGISVTARVGGGDGVTFSGAEKDLDALEQKAAEQIYAQTQPYRYAVYETDKKHYAEAKRVFLMLANNDSSTERTWAQIGLGSLEEDAPYGSEQAAAAAFLKASISDPDLSLAIKDLSDSQHALGHDEAGLVSQRKALVLYEQGKYLNASCAAVAAQLYRGGIDSALGDFREAANEFATGEGLPSCQGNAVAAHWERIVALTRAHDPDAAAGAVASPPQDRTLSSAEDEAIAKMSVALELRDWQAVKAAQPASQANPRDATRKLTAAQPLLALAQAESGDTGAADTLIAVSPLDCYFCVRIRGRIAAIEKNWTSSARWFESATKLAPSLPAAFSEWGEMLLRKGDLDGAIAKFEIAHQKGPHFADPLELWGEALIAENRSDLALAKFQEANQYAPHWGRLHLKWGEALRYAGQPDEANRQFAAAAKLWLTPDERAALARERAPHG